MRPQSLGEGNSCRLWADIPNANGTGLGDRQAAHRKVYLATVEGSDQGML